MKLRTMKKFERRKFKLRQVRLHAYPKFVNSRILKWSFVPTAAIIQPALRDSNTVKRKLIAFLGATAGQFADIRKRSARAVDGR